MGNTSEIPNTSNSSYFNIFYNIWEFPENKYFGLSKIKYGGEKMIYWKRRKWYIEKKKKITFDIKINRKSARKYTYWF